jgi:hypothetical protein
MENTTMSVARKWLGDVPEDKYFWCHDGRALKNLPELQVALKDMTEETFRHHTTGTNNDFSRWVSDVIGDERLSADLRRSTTPAQAAKSVAERIVWLRK